MQQMIFIADLIVSGLRAAARKPDITTLSSTPYRQLEKQNTKHHRQQPSV